MASGNCPGGATSCSQGREPLVTVDDNKHKPRRGDIDGMKQANVAPPGLSVLSTTPTGA